LVQKIARKPDCLFLVFVAWFLERISLTNKVAIVTGANSGLGFHTAKWLAQLDVHVILACRDPPKGAAAVQEIKQFTKNGVVEFMELDLASLSSVKQFAINFKEKGLPLHILLNNAGTMGVEGLTLDGFEFAFGVNYLGHYLLAKLLQENLQNSAPSRVIFVVSDPDNMGTTIPYQKVQAVASSVDLVSAYAASKLAIAVMANHMAKALEGTAVTVNCVFPGYAQTQLYRQLPGFLVSLLSPIMKDPEDCALPILYCCASLDMNGLSGLMINEKARERQHTPFALKPENMVTLTALSAVWAVNTL